MKDKFAIGLIYCAATTGAVYVLNILEPRAVLVVAVLALWAVGILVNARKEKK